MRARTRRYSYFLDFKNAFEAFHIIISLVTIVYYVSYVTNEKIIKFDVNTEVFPEMFDVRCPACVLRLFPHLLLWRCVYGDCRRRKSSRTCSASLVS